MPSIQTMRRAAKYAERHLQAIRADMGGQGYSKQGYTVQMRNDVDLAIAMLKVVADFFQHVPGVLGYVEANPMEDLRHDLPILVNSVDRLNRALILGQDRKQAENL